ncbi:LptF/LptG family permease [Salinispira pacifica]
MNRITGRLAASIIVTFLLALLFFIFLSLFQFPVRAVLPRYYWNWVLANAAVELINSAIPLTCTALLIGFSLLIHEIDLRTGPGPSTSFPALVRAPMIFLLVLTLLYVVSQEWILPAEVQHRQTYVYNSALAQQLFDRAKSSYDNGEYQQALTRVEQYLSVNPDDDKARELRRDALSRIPTGNPAPPEDRRKVDFPAIPVSGEGLSIQQLLDRSSRYFQSEDYFSAYYYATLVLRADPRQNEAQRLQSRSLDRIRSVDVSSLAKEQADIFSRKRQGFLDLESGNTIAAYYIFHALSKRAPGDPDVQRYLAAAKAGVEQISFFADEITGIIALPGVQRVMFVNERSETYVELLYFGKLITAPEGVYVVDVELIRFTPGGKIQLHLHAPYGKIVSQQLILRAIARNNSGKGGGVTMQPAVYRGALPKDTGPIFALQIPVRDLATIAQGPTRLSSAGLVNLWSAVKVLGTYGYATQPVHLEIAMRILLPFSFIILAFLSLSLGWRLRSRYLSRPPILTILLLPMVPVVVAYLFRLYTYGFRSILGFTTLYAGFTVTLIVLLASQAVLLALALFSLAVQSTE